MTGAAREGVVSSVVTGTSEPYEGDAKERRELAERFAPVLVLYPEIKNAGDKTDQTDYHPRDIRLALTRVLKLPSHEGSGIAGLLSGAGRQFPGPIIVADVVVLTLCVNLMIALLLVVWCPSSRDPIATWIFPFMALYGVPAALLAYPVSVSAFFALQVVFRQSTAAGVAFFVLGMLWYATSLLLLAASASLGASIIATITHVLGWSTGNYRWLEAIAVGFIISWVVVYRARPWFLRQYERVKMYQANDVQYLLKQLNDEKIAKDERKQYLVFVGAGGPGDKDGHRKLYREVLAGTARPLGGKGNKKQKQSSEEIRAAYPTTAYVRLVRGRQRWAEYVAIQYWLVYFYNDWANTHEMDWEQVTVYVKLPRGETHEKAIGEACGYSAHVGGMFVPWHEAVANPDKTPREHWGHPIVYVALGSHANYAQPGIHRPTMRLLGQTLTWDDVPFLRKGDPERYLDRTLDYETGETVVPSKLVLLPEPSAGVWTRACQWGQCPSNKQAGPCDGNKQLPCIEDFRWLNLNGVWGSPGGVFGGDAAPQSPPLQDSWRDPFAWLEACLPARGPESPAAELLLKPSKPTGWKMPD